MGKQGIKIFLEKFYFSSENGYIRSWKIPESYQDPGIC